MHIAFSITWNKTGVDLTINFVNDNERIIERVMDKHKFPSKVHSTGFGASIDSQYINRGQNFYFFSQKSYFKNAKHLE